MKKNLILMVLTAILMLIANFTCQAGKTDYYEDTVWVRKTDQADGFFCLSFSTHDSIIVANGHELSIFYNTVSGEEIKRIPNKFKVHFYNNDLNYIQLAPSRDMIVVYDTKTYEAVDTLEFDGETIDEIDISKDEKYLVAVVASGYRLWSLLNGKILRTKTYKAEEYQTKFQIEQITITNDNSKIIATEYREFLDPKDPYNPYYSLRHNIYDFNTFDSLSTFIGKAYYRLSNTNKYIAFKRSETDFGVEIFNFNTGELVQKLAINGYTLTGIEFSPDDKYIVTSSGPDANCMLVWEIAKNSIVYTYPYGSFSNIDISNNGNFIASTTGRYFFMWNFKNGITGVKEETNKINKIIYPNPTNNITTIELELKSTENVKIDLTNTNGEIVKTFLNKVFEIGLNKIEINTSDISSGSYFVVVQSEQEKIIFQIIIVH